MGCWVCLVNNALKYNTNYQSALDIIAVTTYPSCLLSIKSLTISILGLKTISL